MLPLRRLLPVLLVLLSIAPAAVAAGHPALRDTSHVFQLGEIEVVALRAGSAGAVEERVTEAEVHRAGRVDYTQVLALTPGLVITNGGSRNEGGLYLRGFDLRQVPLYVDGIPVYVPYDGYVDLRRFTTSDVAQITIAKGFSSVLYGPNALGGAINVLTRRPTSPLEVSGSIGVLDGGAHEDLTVGTRQALWYAQASAGGVNQREFRLPASFAAVKVQPGGERVNAKREDWRGGVKLGLTPNATDEYALVVATQQGEKGNPPYTGSRPDQKVRYWRWPQWDKENAYLITRTALGWGSLLKGRLYYDHFKNTVCAYDDATYTTQKKKSSFTSYYDDPTSGGSLEWSLPTGARNTVRTAFHAKYDLHREHNAGELESKVEDLMLSGSAEDTWKLADRLTAVAGASYSNRRALSVNKYVDGALEDQPKGTDAAWNGEGALLCDIAGGTVRASIAQRTRFATMKDRYSYKMGTALPNPTLNPETALHYELAWSGPVCPRLQTRVAVFYSRIADLIQSVDDVSFTVDEGDTTWLSQMRNVGDARSMGVEVGCDAQPLRRLRTGASYSYVDRRNLDHPEIKQVGTPWNTVTAYVDVTPLRWCSLRGSVFGYGARYATDSGLTLAPFLTGEVRGTFEVAPGVAVEGGVANLMDVRYELDEGFPEPGRSWFADVRFALSR